LMSNYAETGCFDLSYAFDALLCWNWPFSVHNRLTLRITLIKWAHGFEQTVSWDRPKRTCPLGLKRGRKGHMKTIVLPISTDTKQGFDLRLDEGPL
jgi:hypothetical protein